MDYIAISIMYCLIIVSLIIIHKYQKKYIKENRRAKISNDFKGVDLTQLQDNYEILNKMLDNVKAGKKEYDKKAC